MNRLHDQEENDIPFVSNELEDDVRGTMDKPLDTADAPGRADSELVEDGLAPRTISQTAG